MIVQQKKKTVNKKTFKVRWNNELLENEAMKIVTKR